MSLKTLAQKIEEISFDRVIQTLARLAGFYSGLTAVLGLSLCGIAIFTEPSSSWFMTFGMLNVIESIVAFILAVSAQLHCDAVNRKFSSIP